MDKFMDILSNMGFPIALSIYLLVRLETRLDTLTESIQKLSLSIHTLSMDKEKEAKQ